MISKQLAYDIAVAFESIEHASKMLAEVEEQIERERQRYPEPIRDHFGRAVHGVQMHIPSGNTGGYRIYNVSWELARPIIKGHLADRERHLEALQVQAAFEAKCSATAKTDAEGAQ